MGVCDHETNVGGDCANIPYVVCDSLQLQQNGPYQLGSQRDFHSSRSFQGLAESCAMRETRISRDTLGQENGLLNWQLFEQLLGTFMGVEHAKLQVEDRFTGDGEIEVTGLDNPRVDGSDRHLKNALS